LILQKIIKIVATRCHILRLKFTKFDFGWGSAPDPAGGAYSAPPDPLAAFKGPTSKGREGRKGRERKGEGRGRNRKGKGRGGREKEGRGRVRVHTGTSFFPLRALLPCMCMARPMLLCSVLVYLLHLCIASKQLSIKKPLVGFKKQVPCNLHRGP